MHSPTQILKETVSEIVDKYYDEKTNSVPLSKISDQTISNFALALFEKKERDLEFLFDEKDIISEKLVSLFKSNTISSKIEFAELIKKLFLKEYENSMHDLLKMEICTRDNSRLEDSGFYQEIDNEDGSVIWQKRA